MMKLPPKEDPRWDVFYRRVDGRVARELEGGRGADAIVAAWNMAAREVFRECEGKKRGAQKGGRLPRNMPTTLWGSNRGEGGRWWAALRDIQRARKVVIEEPELYEGDRRLSRAEVIAEAEKKLQGQYRHPREVRADWDEGVFQERLDWVRRVVGEGARMTGGVVVPTWEEFRAYVSELPEGKAGWGFLRY